MKKRYYIAIVVLLLFSLLTSIQVIADASLFMERKSNFIEQTIQVAESVSLFLAPTSTEAEEAFIQAMGNTKTSLEVFVEQFKVTDRMLWYNVLWTRQDFLAGNNFYIPASYIQDRFEKIYEKCLAGEELKPEDTAYINELKLALDQLLLALRNEDGSLNHNTKKSPYFVTCLDDFFKPLYH